MSTITKAHLSNKVAHAIACTKTEASSMVNKFLEKLTSEILSRDKLLLSGFGKFDRKLKTQRLGRNPQTGEPMTLDARTVVTFSASGKLRKAINGGDMWASRPHISVEMLYKNEYSRNREAERAARTIMITIANSLLDGDRVEIRGFGVFSVREYPGYTGRNPKTGEKVAVGPKKLPFFKPGRELLRRANV